MSKSITFLASLPTTTAIRMYGDGGARLMLDVPATEVEAMQALMRCGGKVLSVAIVVAEKPEHNDASKFYRD